MCTVIKGRTTDELRQFSRGAQTPMLSMPTFPLFKTGRIISKNAGLSLTIFLLNGLPRSLAASRCISLLVEIGGATQELPLFEGQAGDRATLQTVNCSVAGLPATPLWIAGFYSKSFASINKYWVPAAGLQRSALRLSHATACSIYILYHP
ncbi:hypothetical protein GJ744_006775 [Endocarpon pusillum]|uniref:Uncharacterized protein n=1 Tax=Endocarpon pusillum TaxID=364733 RepID=A0A8H7A7Y3_9EURO|nr:hypothetical protein GJ744_006775 [Endocarpon pusillum]